MCKVKNNFVLSYKSLTGPTEGPHPNSNDLNWLDIIIALLLAYAVWEGWRQGVITQILGIAALALGIYLGWKAGYSIGTMFGLEGTAASAAGFAIVLVAVIVAVVLVGKLTKGLFRIVGLGVFDRVLGVVFSIFKMCLIAGLILNTVAALDPRGKVLSEKTRESSVLYEKVTAVAGFTFPFIRDAVDGIFDKK